MEEEVLPHNNSVDYKAGNSERPASKASNSIVDEGDDLLDNCPPDFALAWKHSDAHKVKNLELFGVANKNIEDDERFCPWCRFPTSKAVPKYSLCTSTVKLEDLGSGFPLYYQLKIFLSITYIIMFIVVGIAGVVINVNKDKGSEWVGGSTPSYPTKMSIGNFGKDSDNYKLGGILAESILNLLFIFAILFGSIILRRIQNKVINDIDEANLTPSDYWVMITNLPKDKTQEETKEYLEKVSPGIEIVYINYCYKIKEIVDISRKLMNLQNMKSYIESYRKNRLRRLGMDESEAEAKGINLHPPPSKLWWWWCKKEYFVYYIEIYIILIFLL